MYFSIRRNLQKTITSIFIVVCLLTCNLCVVVVLSKLLLSSKQPAASSSHRGASTPQAPQRPLFSRNILEIIL
jgi:hypothetical protein